MTNPIRKHPPIALALIALVALLAAPASAGHLDAYQGTWDLDGASEVPPANSAARGHCTAVLDGLSLYLSCTSNLGGVTGAHIHRGFAGENGDVEVALTAGRVIGETVVLTEEQAALAVQGGLYINLHTEAFPGGELRGQVTLDQVEGTSSILARGGAASEVPPADSDATAACRVFVDPSALSARFVCTHDVEGATAAHLHMGAPGEAGDVVFPFAAAASPIIETFDLTEDQLQELLGGNYYVNIHSDAVPSGEARVDIVGCAQNDTTLCMNNNRFAAAITGVNPNDESAFTGQAAPLSSDSGTFSFFRTGNKEMLVKVLDGCAINSSYWVFLLGDHQRRVHAHGDGHSDRHHKAVRKRSWKPSGARSGHLRIPLRITQESAV